MTDPQFQPGQPTPPTQQAWGVFGGNPEEIVHDISMFGPLQQPEVSHEPQTNVAPFGGEVATAEDAVSFSPFDGFVIPQDTPTVQEDIAEPVVQQPVVEEPTIEEPVIEEATPEIILPTEPVIQEPVVEEPIVEEPVVEEPVVEEEPKEEPVGQPVSDIQQKFTTLGDNVSQLSSLLRLKDGEMLEIVWSNNDKLSVLYQFGMNEQKEILVKRIETEKDDDETTFNEMKLLLNPETDLFEIFLDDVLLFEESDLLKDNKKKSQVMEKLNKFIFLTESKLKDTEKLLRAKQEEEEERRRLQDIFRNF